MTIIRRGHQQPGPANVEELFADRQSVKGQGHHAVHRITCRVDCRSMK